MVWPGRPARIAVAGLQSGGAVRRLFVYVPPITAGTDLWEKLAARLKTEPECQDDDFRVCPELRSERITIWSRGTMEQFGADVAAQIDNWDRVAGERGNAYDEVVLVGNSVGGLLVRWAWLYGFGAFAAHNQRQQPQAWAVKVRRIVLCASVNRGLTTRLEPGRRSIWLLLFKVVVSMASPFGFAWKEVLAGSSFVTNLRLVWMRTMAGLQANQPQQEPEVVQILGTHDRLVSQEDSRDVEQFPRAAQITIARATHSTVLDLSGPSGEDRYLLLRTNILRTPKPTDPAPADQERATDVVFVVHGIRAGVYGWVPDVRRRISEAGPRWRVVVPTYRFFSALAFAFPVTRRRKVRWFLDQYSREFAQHRDARFHFVGHSNGTYLLGRAVWSVSGVRFDRVYLAGSVLPAEFPWLKFLETTRQISLIRSDRGSRDIPVALLAQGLRGLRMKDIGGGGFEGFADLNTPPAVQWPYFKGGHGAPLSTPERRQSVAAFVTTGAAEPPTDLIDGPGGTLAVLSRFSKNLVRAAAALIVACIAWVIVAPGVASIITIVVLAVAFAALAVI